MDAWRQSEHCAPQVFQNDKKKRMAYTFRRAVRAMAVTSSTTSVAFFANIFSPVMPIRSFGIISVVIIPINYFFVVMFMPPAVIYYEEKFAQKAACCGCLGSKEKVPIAAAAEPDKIKLTRVERFFDETWSPFVMKYKVWILAVAFVWIVFATT